DLSGSAGPAGPPELRAAIAEAVRRTLLSDRPLGLALSGGLDSTIIAHEVQAAGIEDLDTISLTPQGDSDGVRSLDALGLAPGAHQGWRHHHVEFGPSQLLGQLAEAVSIMAAPTAMTSVPLYLAVAQAARQAGIVVLLVGEGADELFGGYRSYLGLEQADTTFDFYHQLARAELVAELVGTEQLDAARQALREALPGHADVRAGVAEFERVHSLQPLLERTDLLTMACSIEARTPFLHGGIVAHADALAWADKYGDGQTKRALRRAYADVLPRFAHEQKTPFRAPWARWCRHELAAPVRQLLLDGIPELAAVGIRPAGVQLICRRLAAGQPEAVQLAFCLTTMVMWLRGGAE
nr:asparagine synthase C-terminal domain-containing protein [Actinomycetota bacterium]